MNDSVFLYFLQNLQKGGMILPDLTTEIHALLQPLTAAVYYHFPASAAALPCLTLCQTGNEVHARADGKPCLYALEYTLEVWAQGVQGVHDLSAQADALLTGYGLERAWCCDLFDTDTGAHRRVLRYRTLCDENGVLTK